MFFITIEQKSSCDPFCLIYCKNITSFLFWVLWTRLVTSIKNSNVNFDVYLHAKNQLHLTSFLKYCKDIANMLFWELWECLIIPFKIIVSICKKLSCLSSCKKSTSSLIYFLKILQRNSKLVILGNLGMPDHTHLK